MTEKHLIDAGRSSRGWSRIGNFFKCPQLFAYGERLDISLIPGSALTRGSMGHVMQAHLHAIWGCKQGGVWVDEEWFTDAESLLGPEESLHAWCEANGDGYEHIDRMTETFRRYLAQYPEPPGRIIAVEYPVTAVLGEKAGRWGLWVVHPEEQGFDHRSVTVKACDGDIIKPSPLNVPGHPDHGAALTLTRRIDMTVQDRSGREFIWDHKHQARVDPNRSVDAYAIDGGFAAFRIMGRQLYKNFGGVALNLIQTQPQWKVARPMVPATPHRDRHFAEMLWRAEHNLARLDVDCPDLWSWPKSQHETTCFGRYGKCAALKLCFYGQAGQY